MKLTQNTSPVAVSGAVSAPSTFNIAASKEGFKILSSGLYTNKIRAIVRELSCNAFDAHVAAGVGHEPFSLHLPTTFEPFFAVKDHGTGLEFVKGGCKSCSGAGRVQRLGGDEALFEECAACQGSGDYDAVKVLYCTYFASNKSDSNLFVGALGLGSKSPFCYAEGFSVTNIYDGMTRIYSCYINEAGMPAVLLQTEEATPGAPNGVEVSFPVRQKDVWEFENQAKYALEFFDPAPELNIQLNIQSQQYTTKNARWGMRKGEGEPRAIQGMVQYSIGEIDESRLSQEQQKLAQLPLDLFFPIGELSVAASRESLSNDETTVQNILKALDRVREGLLAEFKQDVAKCATPWEARLLIYNMSNKEHIGYLVGSALQAGLLDNVNPGFKLSRNKPKIKQTAYPALAIWEFEYRHRYASKNKPQSHKTLLTEPPPPPGETSNRINSTEVSFPDDEDNVLFVINDLGPGHERYIHHLIQSDNSEETKTVFFLTGFQKSTQTIAVTDQAFKLVEEVGRPPVKLLSELKEKYKDAFKAAAVAAGPVPAREVLRFNMDSHINEGTLGWINSWDNYTGKELPEGIKYYVPLRSLVPQTGNFRDCSEFKQFFRQVAASGRWAYRNSDPIYGIPFWKVDKLDSTWKELFGCVMGGVKRVLTPETESLLSLRIDNFSSGIESALTSWSKKRVLPVDSPMQEFVERYAQAHKQKHGIAALRQVLARATMLELYKPGPSVSLTYIYSAVEKLYPLLEFVSSSYREEFTRSVTEYVMLMDQERRNEAERRAQAEELAALFTVPTNNPAEAQTTTEESSNAIN